MNSSNSRTQCILPRQIFSRRTEIKIESKSALLFGELEPRSKIEPHWLNEFCGKLTYQIIPNSDELHLVKIPRYRNEWFSLRNQEQTLEFFHLLGDCTIYLDITGLPIHVWMPLIRVCIEADVEVNCIYVEPGDYAYNPNPKPGEFFDLSERIHGFSPIPTFARLISRRTEECALIPLLGFEGIRFKHLIEKMEPNEQDILPVVGVPGFKLRYPFYSFEGNATELSRTRSWQRVSYVDAACPFSLFSHLASLHDKDNQKHFQIATIGTKPHALGAMLYALKSTNVELLYDHPVRNEASTTGKSRCHLYRVSFYLRNQNIA